MSRTKKDLDEQAARAGIRIVWDLEKETPKRQAAIIAAMEEMEQDDLELRHLA